jgi:hypothetical protein
MKTYSPTNDAFTRTELVVVLAISGFLMTWFVHAQLDPQDKARRERQLCVVQLKQVGLAFRIWSNDHNDKFPMAVPAAGGGSLEAVQAGEPYRHFKAIANELTKAKLVTCPSDDRDVADGFDTLKNANLSYFVGIDADETKPQMLLAGDRNITNGVATKKGILELSDLPAPGWTDSIHKSAGNIGLADGSAQQADTAALRRQIDAAKRANANGKTRLHLPEVGSGSAE